MHVPSITEKLRRGRGIVGLLWCWVAGCGVSPPPDVKPQAANVVSLDPQNWYIFYSANMPSHPSADRSGVWSFEFPGPNGHVNYVQTPFNSTTTLHSITITFRVDSDAPQYKVIDPADKLPATVHLFFEQLNDDLANPNGRWWSFDSGYNLGSQDNTTLTINVPLTPDIWSNVYGQHDPTAFNQALQNVGWVGVTFGGYYFYGHGAALSSGTAKYVLVNFAID